MTDTDNVIEKGNWFTTSIWVRMAGATFLCIILVAILARVSAFSHISELGSTRLAFAVYIVISLGLAGIPILIAHVQTTAKEREKAKLEGLIGQPASNTMYFKKALSALASIRPARINNSDYTIPIMTFGIVLFFGWCFVMAGVFFNFSVRNVILGGMSVDMSVEDLVAYQSGTYVCMSAAFFSCYIYVIARLLERINNNDIYPITFYYYTMRFISVLIIAAVLRHTLKVTDSELLDSSKTLVVLGFAVGYAPDLFFTYVVGKAFELLKLAGSSRTPDQSTVPTEMPLVMIEGLSKAKIDRLNELSIDSAQVLGCQNPFSIWPRLPFDLGLVVDWIAQAILYSLVKEAKLKSLREKLVTDIFDFHERLANKDTRAEICAAIGLDVAAADGLVEQLINDQSFQGLLEVRTALTPSTAVRPGLEAELPAVPLPPAS